MQPSSTEPRESRVHANGIDHHVIRWGSGDRGTFVLCHGLLDMAWSWSPVAQRLAAEGFAAVAFDWRGHGESDWVGRGGYYHFPDYVLDLEELLPQLVGPEAPVLVGHSMGGTACAMYAGVRAERLRGLVLVEGLGPRAYPLERAAEKLETWLDDVRRLHEGRGPGAAMSSVDDALIRMRRRNPDLPEDLGRWLAERGTKPAPDGRGRIWRFDPLHRTTSPMPFRPEILERFTGRISLPVLLVFGERGFRPADEAERAAAIRGARSLEIPGVGHMIHWLAPDRLAEALVEHTTHHAP